MSLSDLKDLARGQNEVIRTLPRGLDSETDNCADWTDFKNRVWGKGLETFQNTKPVNRDDPDPVNDVALPEYHDIARTSLSPDRLPSHPSARQT